MKTLAAATLLLFTFALVACSGLAQPTSTPVPASTFTPVPTQTILPAPTTTTVPLTETQTVASEWEGIPIMPGALTGDGDEEGYVFTTKAVPQQIQRYYEIELGKLGWKLSSRGQGDNSSLILTFTNNASATLTVNILAKGNEVLVLLGK